MELEKTINSHLSQEEIIQRLTPVTSKNPYLERYMLGVKYLISNNDSQIKLTTIDQPFIDIKIKVENETVSIQMIHDDQEKSLIQGLGYGLGFPVTIVIFLMLAVLDPTNPNVYFGFLFVFAGLYLFIKLILMLRTKINLAWYMSELRKIIRI